MRRLSVLGALVALGGLVVVVAVLAAYGVRAEATRRYGPASDQLGVLDRWEYAARLVWRGGSLDSPRDPGAASVRFRVEASESISSVANRLEREGLVSNAEALLDYLVYTGKDRTIQAGEYSLSAASPPVEIAAQLQDATPAEVTFVVLPGWRVEEIAASIPTSGLEFSQVALLEAVLVPPSPLDFLPEGLASREGLLAPDSYVLPRTTTAQQFVEALTARFAASITPELQAGFAAQGLSVYESVILASIVEREAVQDAEQAQIASVFLNRLRAGMSLDSDPTVQYALGYNLSQQTWWTNPLSAVDLDFPSPYNTYLNSGLPPSPICNPGIAALEAVARPEVTPYYYFRARCDTSGLHSFSRTFEEHVRKACP